jgi:uncharacterized protein (DUF305 family)
MTKIIATVLISTAAFAYGCGSPVTSNSGNSGSGANSHAGHDMSNANHHASAPNAAAQPYDLQFLDSMIHHHEGAVSMAEMVLRKSEREEMKSFARKIIEDQNREIAQMRSWREAWFAGKPPAMNMDLPGMKKSMMTPEHEKMMESASGTAFDIHFVDMMVPHHEGAVEMSREMLVRGERAELKSLAEQIIKAQDGEIKQMQAWKSEWSK